MENCNQKISLNDIFDELRDENTRLCDQLLFANKCVHILLKFKTYLYDNHIINKNISNDLRELENEFNSLLIINKKISEDLNDNQIIEENKQNRSDVQINEFINGLSKPSKLSFDNKNKIIKNVNNRRKKTKAKIAKHNHLSDNDCSFSKSVTRDNVCINFSEKSSQENVEVCDKTRSDRKESIKKSAKKYWRPGFQCDWVGCDFVAYTRNKLSYHKNKHIGVQPYKCPVIGCEKTFYSETNMKNHANFVHELKKTICCDWPQCKAMFKNRSNLNSHMKIHTIPHNEKPFVCDFADCTYRALSKTILISHKRIHNEIKQFKCRECGKEFKLEGTLRSHLIVHTKNMPYKCDWPECEVAYRCWTSLHRHKLKHQNIDAHIYSCDWPGCDYRSNRRDVLSRHKISHTDERNYCCSWPSCDRKLKTEKSLKEHLMIHMNDKRHKCQWPGCEYRCVLAGNLKKHFNTHCKK